MHGIVTPALYGLAGLMSYAAIYHFSVGINSPRSLVQISFAGVCLMMIPFAISMVPVLKTDNPVTYIRALKENLTSALLFFAVFNWFIALYTGEKIRTILVIWTLIFAILIIKNQASPYSLQFSEFQGTKTMLLPWGERITHGEGGNGPWFLVGIISVASVFIHALIGVTKKYEQQRLKSDLAILITIFLFLLTVVQGIMVRLGIVHGIILGPFGLVAVVLCMSIALGFETQQKLRISERHFRSLFEDSPTGMLAVDPQNGHIIQANHVATKLTEYDSDEILTKTIFDLASPEDRKDSEQRYVQLSSGLSDQTHYEQHYRTKSGTTLTAEYNVSSLKDEKGKIVRFIANITDITERKKTEEALHQSENKYRTIFKNSPLGIFRSNKKGQLIEANPALAKIYGYSSPEVMIKEVTAEQIYTNPEDRNVIMNNNRGGFIQYFTEHRRIDGSVFLAHITVNSVNDVNGDPIFFDGIVEDVTAQKRAEKDREELQAMLLQSQKIESVGRLAGGIAHDFNNMLGVIISYTELASQRIREDQILQSYLEEIRNAADRSTELTRQLLTFARKQSIEPKIIDPNEAVESMLKLLQRMISEDVTLEWIPGPDIWPVMIDPSQLDQILANLCVNARDAIEGTGKVNIETSNTRINSEFSMQHPGSKPGDYVRITISDTGRGMDADTLSKIFDPFFTTKEMGKGTGLGLSTVYGIVQQCSGFIEVRSRPDHGTTFDVYLPRNSAVSDMDTDPFETEDLDLENGQECLLLVEDEPAILNVAKLMLESSGYKVYATNSPEEAIQIAKNPANDIHLLITDVIMPKMNGRELAKKVLEIRPRISCLYMSGYSGDIINALSGEEVDSFYIIQKPFTVARLTNKVREILDI